MRHYLLDVAIWLLDDAIDGQTLRDQALDALHRCRPAPGVTAYASHPTGVRGVDAMDGRGMTLKVVIEENVWVTEREDNR